MNRRIITLFRIIKSGIRNFFRNAWLSTAAIAVMFVTLMIVLLSIGINRAIDQTVESISEEVKLSVFINDGISESATSKLQAELDDSAAVTRVEYISTGQAFEDFKESNKDDPDILKGLEISENPFPSSVTVTLNRLDDIQAVLAITDKEDYSRIIEETSYNEQRQESIDNILGTQRFLTLAGIIGSVIFAGISVLIIMNTIRMAIYARSEEVEIMKLVGATRGYIRGPFLLESMIYGLVAAVLALSIIYGYILFVSPDQVTFQLIIAVDTQSSLQYFRDNMLSIVFGTIAIGMGIGYVSSRIALMRYMKQKDW